jgi:nucleoside-diphosphate kinase
MHKTLSILKPDAVRRNITGKINAMIESAGFQIVAQKMVRLSKAQAEGFYEVHKDRPFFGELVDSMTAGRVVVQVLRSENAIEKYRKLMGATNPKDAEAGTIRAEHAVSIGENSVHGSDSEENAAKEINFFFSESEFI